MGQATRHDVAVVGAGPAGTVAAMAFARRGARVALFEAQPNAKNRFAGEWLHPQGVAVLDELRLGRMEAARPRAGYGFVILPDDGGEPIELPYKSGVSLSADHGAMVGALRDVAADHDLVDYFPHAKVLSIQGNRLEVRSPNGETRVQFADRVIGADGRSSVVRRAARIGGKSTPMSHMAAVLLKDATLPFEGFGHVVLGGPGPLVIYRISDDEIRVCMDIPLHYGPSARTPKAVWHSFGRVIPPSLQPAFRCALEAGTLRWAVNRFRPRSAFGEHHIALIGDALGHVHPMTAVGMTLGFLDARAVASAPSLEAYATERSSLVPELLANALYHCFRREDPSASALRRTMFRVLRQSEKERERTLRILSAEEPRTSQFTAAFLKMAREAALSTVTESVVQGELLALPRRLRAYGEWLEWPLASLLARPAFQKLQPRPSRRGPLAESEVEPETKRRAVPVPAVAEARKKTTDRFIHELIKAAMAYGRVPDEELLRPQLSMVRAIISGPNGKSLTSRMEFGRRRIRVEGMDRLLNLMTAATCELREVCEALLIVAPREAGRPTEEEKAVIRLRQVLELMLSRQITEGRDRGAFPIAFRGPKDADLRTTALTVRAFDAVASLVPPDLSARCRRAIQAVRDFAIRRQNNDGSFGEGDARISETAFGAIAMAVQSPAHPSVRRACQILTDSVGEDGWVQTKVERRAATARAVRALLLAHSGHLDAIHRMVQAIRLHLESVEELGDDPEAQLAVEAELLEAVSLFAGRMNLVRREDVPGTTRPAPGGPTAEDRAYCVAALEAVSRTFSKPIALLPAPLDQVVTVSYLLCRIADTFEDHPDVPHERRRPGLVALTDLLEERGTVDAVVDALGALPKSDAELDLVRNLETVMRVHATFSPRVRQTIRTWVGEMARGMLLYTERRPAEDGIRALLTIEDLERYCYYVAGTVGHLLTDLFVDRADLSADAALRLREHAEAFGMGLQLTNILKDVTDDGARRVSFIPRTLCLREGLSPLTLASDDTRDRSHRAVEPIFRTARGLLDRGLTYALTIPAEEVGIRLFCLLPLFMAARTLRHAKDNDAMFIPDRAVKISREDVGTIIELCRTHAANDEALSELYTALWRDAQDLRRTSA
ncbi:MAG: squalene/phytoene synthase family protein [Myxococcota bacterium]